MDSVEKSQSVLLSEFDVPSSIAELFLTNRMTDVVFVIGNDKELCFFPAHKLILAVRSSVFKAMFTANFVEKEANEVKIVDTNAEAFETILRFIYTDKVILDDSKHVFDVLYLAEKYLLPNNIFDECVNHLSKKICVENFVDVINIASAFFTDKKGYGQLKRTAWRFLSENGEYFIQSKGFTKLDFDTVQELVRRDSLNVISEVAVFNSLVTWATLKCLKSGFSITPLNKRLVLQNSLYLVRYLNMSLGEFNEGPAVSGLLSIADIASISNAIATGTYPIITYSPNFNPSTWSDARGKRTSVEKVKYIETSKGVDAVGTQSVESVLVMCSQDVILASIKYLKDVSDKLKTVVVNMSTGQEQFSGNCRYLKSVEPNVYLKANVIYKILTFTTFNALPIGTKINYFCNQELNNCRPLRLVLKSYSRKNITQDDIESDALLNSLFSNIAEPIVPPYCLELSTVIQSLCIVV